ncbi:MAG: shikimate kinase, partial [Dysgonamonadaceae bacterium]|nr:shikimate kinase [Dysgonamonadaceae bacterium]
FREIEREVLQEVAQFENTIISTGGGAPCFFDNMDWMNRTGITIYLKVSVSELTRRLITGRQKRPLIRDKNREDLEQFIAANLNKREAWYNRATIIFPAEQLQTKKGIDTIVNDLIERINESKI